MIVTDQSIPFIKRAFKRNIFNPLKINMQVVLKMNADGTSQNGNQEHH